MIRHYDIPIAQERQGTAVVLKQPALQGTILAAVTDVVHLDRARVYACECTDEQHAANRELPGARVLSEEEAQTLAVQYRPERRDRRYVPGEPAEQEVLIPAADLRGLVLLNSGAGTPAPARVAAQSAPHSGGAAIQPTGNAAIGSGLLQGGSGA